MQSVKCAANDQCRTDYMPGPGVPIELGNAQPSTGSECDSTQMYSPQILAHHSGHGMMRHVRASPSPKLSGPDPNHRAPHPVSLALRFDNRKWSRGATWCDEFILLIARGLDKVAVN